ncbi:MAG: NAD-dependent epimerase/dehydratase family protein [Nitrospinales bacterium]
MNVLITGGGGFLGGHLARRLHSQSETVCVLGRRHYEGLPEGMESLKVDIRDREDVIRACLGRDTVFHTAAIPGIWGDKKQFFDINVEGTRNVIEGCRRNGVKKLIYTSSPSVIYDNSDMENVNEDVPYPESYLCEYPRTKAIAEKLVMDANGQDGLLTVSLRPHLIWGPGDPHLVPRIIEKTKKGQLIRVGEGRNKVDMTHIENTVEAHIIACRHLAPDSPVAGRCYFISDGEPVLLWDWINHLLDELKLPRVTRSISYKNAKFLGGLMEAIYRILHLSREPRMTRFLASQLATSHYYDISRARRDFDYRPVISQEEGMRQLIKYLQDHQEH